MINLVVEALAQLIKLVGASSSSNNNRNRRKVLVLLLRVGALTPLSQVQRCFRAAKSPSSSNVGASMFIN